MSPAHVWSDRGRVALSCVAALVVTCGVVPVGAQQVPTQLPPGEQPTFRADVTLITNDVIVRDRDGQLVSDLTRDSFEIYEDGVRQEIASLVLIHGGRAFNLQLPAAAAVQEGIILPAARPWTDTAGRIFVLFVDDLHMATDQTPRIRNLFKRIARNLVHEGDLFSMVSSGYSSIAIGLTYDRALLDAAIGKIMGNGMSPREIITGPQGSHGPPELAYRANVAFSTAMSIVRNLEQVEHRRKAVIYVSAGYDLNPFEESRFAYSNERFHRDEIEGLANPFMIHQRSSQFADFDLSNHLLRLTRAANRANATFYTIDPRGLVGGPDIGEMGGRLDPQQWHTYVRKTQASLRILAEATGGIAVVNNNDFDRALQRIDAETSDYYVLGYYSNNSDPTAWRRRLEISVNRDDVDVWSRSEYELVEPDASSDSSRQ